VASQDGLGRLPTMVVLSIGDLRPVARVPYACHHRHCNGPRPGSTQFLGWPGAEVIGIEPPGGQPSRRSRLDVQEEDRPASAVAGWTLRGRGAVAATARLE
jgi:hypothetical protein